MLLEAAETATNALQGVVGLPQESYRALAGIIGNDTLSYFAPELVICVAMLLVLLVDVSDKLRSPRNLMLVALVALAAPALMILGKWGGEALFFYPAWGNLAQYSNLEGHISLQPDSHMLVFDGFANFFKVFVLASGLITLGMIHLDKGTPRRSLGEMLTLLLGSVLGMMLLASATNLLMIYLSIEFMSLASFILVAFKRRDRKGTEGALKYMLFGAVSSGVMIYGISLLYGMAGTLDIALIGQRLAQVNDPLAIAMALMMVTVGFGYKMSIAPMHFWAPDAYEGAPTPVTAFLSVASKAAGFAVFIRFIDAMSAQSTGNALPIINWVSFVAVIGAVTMTVGNLTAIWQPNVKRMLAYSSIAHAGYLMIGAAVVAAGGEIGGEAGARIADVGGSATAFYLVAYCLMNFGAFAVVQVVANETGRDDMNAFDGLFKRNPTLAVVMAILLLSLLGIPPTFGFIGKARLFMAGLEAAQAGYPIMTVLLVIAAVNTTVSCYYYFRLIRGMFITPGEAATANRPLIVSNTGWLMAGGSAVLTLALFVAGSFFIGPADEARLKRRPHLEGAAMPQHDQGHVEVKRGDGSKG
ncbi:MAG: NADH-quinone oxidoreductase subunit N [Planctomycetes bacterium]|nr:NADH-quinone oxidoreductase subunit N [Planctomycetota bacterium]